MRMSQNTNAIFLRFAAIPYGVFAVHAGSVMMDWGAWKSNIEYSLGYASSLTNYIGSLAFFPSTHKAPIADPSICSYFVVPTTNCSKANKKSDLQILRSSKLC